MNMMNGAPFYSPPSRHQKTYGFGAKEEKPLLSELPALIEKAIKAGLVTRPVEKVTVKPPKKWKHSWHYVNCTGCGVEFVRGHKHLVQCVTCRRPPRPCKACGKEFTPHTRKRLCCSDACAKVAQGINYRTKK